MPTLIQINVTNKTPFLKNFFFFQQTAKYVGGENVYSNSLLSTPILPEEQGGSTYTFLVNVEYFAGVQQQFSQPAVGQPSGYMSAIRPIELTPAAGGKPVNNCTQVLVNPALGLSLPARDDGVQPGAFRLISPSYDPRLQKYNAGSAVRLATGGIILSNFVTMTPATNLDCQPILKFYVQTGNYTAGTVMNFTQSSVGAALCDATAGYNMFNVIYETNGTWSVTPGVANIILPMENSDEAHTDNIANNVATCN